MLVFGKWKDYFQEDYLSVAEKPQLALTQKKNIEKNALDDVFLIRVDSTLIDRRIYLGFDYSKKQIDSIEKDPSIKK